MTNTWQYLSDNDPETIPDEWVWERLRLRRDTLLAASDSRVTPDAPGDVDAWRTYRQALRDLPATTTDPRMAVWPVAPTGTTPHPNRTAVLEAARAALAANRTFVASTPTATQSAAQVKALSRQVNGLLRVLLGDLTGTD